jgi:ribosomal subunit interface protein
MARLVAEPGGAIMQTTITVRHCEISEALRERAITVVERLGSLAPRPIETTVVFDTDGTEQTVELRLHLAHGAHGEILVARGEGPDHRTALDRAEEKLRRQVERASDRPRRGRAPQPNNPL